MVFLVAFVFAGPASALDLLAYSTPSSNLYSRPTVTPVGWSPEGHFALSIERGLEGIGGTQHAFLIVDSVSDEHVFARRVDVTEMDPEGAARETADLNEAEAAFTAALDGWGIHRGAGTEYHPVPVRVAGRSYSVDVVTTPEVQSEETWPLDEVDSYQVFVDAGDLGRKRIAARKDVFAYDVWCGGCFVSPFEPRMLVVLIQEQYVFEGTEPMYVFSGAHLTSGYR